MIQCAALQAFIGPPSLLPGAMSKGSSSPRAACAGRPFLLLPMKAAKRKFAVSDGKYRLPAA